MPDTELKDVAMLRRLLDDECVQCAEMFRDNVALITSYEQLTSEQTTEVLEMLLDAHREHR